MGQSIWEYTHQCDHTELMELFHRKSGQSSKLSEEKSGQQERFIDTHQRDVLIRFKCTLTSRGRSINIKSASYKVNKSLQHHPPGAECSFPISNWIPNVSKVIHVTGHVMETTAGYNCLVGICRPIPHPANVEVPLDGNSTFLTKHSPDMKFTYVDDRWVILSLIGGPVSWFAYVSRICALLGYTVDDLWDTSLFQYHHADDSAQLLIAFRNCKHFICIYLFYIYWRIVLSQFAGRVQ